jgi:uridylate kinase
MEKIIVISLGGSVIIPEELDLKFLKKFKEIIQKNYKRHKFIVVCGGGARAREQIEKIKSQGKNKKEQSLAGIKASKTNSKILMELFGKESNQKLPKSMKEMKEMLKKKKIIFSGSLKYDLNQTSDGEAAKIARTLKINFINITNVPGLYTSDPNKPSSNKSKPKLIPKISWKEFESIALKIKFEPGQHFVLDQNASTIIRKNKVKTYIIGSNMKNFDALLNNKKFIGTTIEK